MLNARSIFHKIDELSITVNKLNPSLVCVTETWLHPEINDSLLNIHNYNLFRNDRLHSRGGGVAIWSKNHLTVSTYETSLPKPTNIECLWLNIDSDIIFCVTYIPPNLRVTNNQSIIDYFSSSIDSIKSSNSNTKVIISGDFNQVNCIDLEIQNNMINIVHKPTRSNNILDKIFIESHIKSNYYKCTILPPLKASDHNIVHVKSKNHYSFNRKVVTLFDYRQSNLDTFSNIFNKTNFKPVYDAQDINEKCEMFYELIRPSLRSIPKTSIIMTSKDKTWMTPLTKLLIQKRWDAYRNKDFIKYNHYKEKTSIEILKAKRVWATKSKSNKKGIWSVVQQYQDHKQKEKVHPFNSNEINNYFTSIFNQNYEETNRVDILQEMNDEDWNWFKHIEPAEITHIIKKMKNKSGGYDGLSVKLLQLVVEKITLPLCHIFNESLKSCIYPNIWKTSKIIPIPKIRNPGVKDFRPISLLPIVSKILERCIFNQLKEKFFENYGSNQFGFRTGSSSICAMICLNDFITKTVDQKDVNGATLISLDISKAFDTVAHHKLINCLLNSSVPKGFTLWYMSYLTNRSQFVQYNNIASNTTPVTSGVPQGAILSPSVFCIFISSLKVQNPRNSIFKFADDTAIIIVHTKSTSDEENCKSEILSIKDWYETHNLKLNTEKSKRLHIKHSTGLDYACLREIQEVSDLKLLGIIITNDLKWSSHINYSVKKASRHLYLLRMLRPFVIKKDLTIIYNALIQSILDYGSQLYVGSITTVDGEKINKLVRRAHRIICNNDCRGDCLPNQNIRRQQKSKNLFSQALRNINHVLHPIIPQRLPSGRRLNVPLATSSRTLNSFINYMTTNYNSTA